MWLSNMPEPPLSDLSSICYDACYDARSVEAYGHEACSDTAESACASACNTYELRPKVLPR